MKVLSSIIIILLTATVIFAEGWQELKGDHFIIYYVEDKDFANKVSHKAEKDYHRIAADLGYARANKFWTWDNRVKIYLYPNRDSYVKYSGQPDWSEGVADYDNKRILSYTENDIFLYSILPHEIAHLIFRDFVGFKSDIPLWLDEGVAQWEEEIKKEEIQISAADSLKKKTFLEIGDLMKFNIRLYKNADKLHLHTSFIEDDPSFMIVDTKSLIDLFYLQSASLVGYMIEQYGTTRFTDFCREVRHGKSIEDALFSAYSPHLKTLKQLEERWIKYLKTFQ